MRNQNEVVQNYFIRLMNDDITSISKADVDYYLKSIGIKDASKVTDSLVSDGTLIPLKNKRISLNLVKLRKG